MVSSILTGLRTAARQPKLLLLLWSWNLLLGAAAALPMWAWLRSALDLTVDGPSLLGRFNVGALADLVKYSGTNPFDLLGAGARGAVVIALVGSAFVNGGILEALAAAHDRRSFMHRFFRGGGHFFWRFVRLFVIAAIPAVFAAGLVAGALTPALDGLADGEWGYGFYLAGLVTLGAVAFVGGFFLLALDYARIRVAHDDSRGMFRAYVGAMGFVLRHAFAAYGMAIVVLVAVSIVLLLYVGHETVWTTTGWATLLLLLAVQQVVILARIGLRVSLVGAQRDYYLARQPRPVAAVSVPAAVPATPAATAGSAVADGPEPDVTPPPAS